MRAILLTQSIDPITEKKKTDIHYQVDEALLFKQEGDILIEVAYSSLNYKDALAISGKSPVVRLWPMVAGIDGVGTVIDSQSNQFKKGDQVLLNGFGCGETHWGCYSEKAKLKSEWLIALPPKLTPWQAMAFGTAGYTAALCVLRLLKEGLCADKDSILVTGATGGVGLIALLLLKKLGFKVTAMTSKLSAHSLLKELGADEVISSESYQEAGKPLQKPLWNGAIDVVGSTVLANICAQMHYNGVVACCGLAKGMDLSTTVAPFILRNVMLAGIDSVMRSRSDRIEAWDFIADHFDEKMALQFEKIITTIDLENVSEQAFNLLSRQFLGRSVVCIKQPNKKKD